MANPYKKGEVVILKSFEELQNEYSTDMDGDVIVETEDFGRWFVFYEHHPGLGEEVEIASADDKYIEIEYVAETGKTELYTYPHEVVRCFAEEDEVLDMPDEDIFAVLFA